MGFISSLHFSYRVHLRHEYVKEKEEARVKEGVGGGASGGSKNKGRRVN